MLFRAGSIYMNICIYIYICVEIEIRIYIVYRSNMAEHSFRLEVWCLGAVFGKLHTQTRQKFDTCISLLESLNPTNPPKPWKGPQSE